MDNVKLRRPKITQDAFDQCIKVLLDKNIEPTVTRIVKEIGGSFNTISPMFEKWRTEKKQSLYDSAVPDFVQLASEKMGKEWWTMVQHDVTDRIQRVENDAQMRVNELKKECDEYLLSIVEFEETLDLKIVEIEKLKQTHAHAIKLVHSQVEEYKELHSESQKRYQALVEASSIERDTIKAEFNKEKEKINAQFEKQAQYEKSMTEKMEKTLSDLIDEKEKTIQALNTKLCKASK